MIARYAVALFVSAMLLFTCQPLVARMIVPLLGGAPSVWILCSLCFQALLLAGYAFAHLSGRYLPLRAQVAVQIVLVLTTFAVLPIHVDEASTRLLTQHGPTLGLVLLLLRAVGLPFFVLSTTAPLLQRWFAELGEKDPYFLYAASNAGSMIALIGYPLLIEPFSTVRAQSRTLEVAFGAYALLIAVCGFTTVQRHADAPAVEDDPAATPITWAQRIGWIALAFAPSSLLLGSTQYVTTDIASIPLLWVLPLAAYLASFIVAFARKQPLSDAVLSRVFAFAAVIVALLLLGNLRTPAMPIVAAHVLLVLIASTACHRALVRRRPHVSHLTEFYFLTSVGGVLGGAFNGLLAPAVFNDLYELPIAIGATLAARAALDDVKLDRKSLAKEIGFGVALGAATFAVWMLLGARIPNPTFQLLAVFTVPIFVAFRWSRQQPVRYGVALAGILLVAMRNTDDTIVDAKSSRNFFGVLRLGDDPSRKLRTLVDGRTVHGKQMPSDPATPTSYYHPTGPAGDVLSHREGPRRVACIGLGVGALAAYAQPGDQWTFFEINPDVVAIANQSFTFLRDARTRTSVEIPIGDGRLLMRDVPSGTVDVIVLDAFSSDAIPTHLLTREALAIYRRALKPSGLLLAHVSNLILRLQPVFGALARDAGMAILERVDTKLDDDLRAHGKDASEWVLLSNDAKIARPGWSAVVTPASQPVWTDDFVNVLGVLR